MSAATMTAPVNPFVSKASAGGDYETCPAGAKPARLLALIDLGTFSEEFEDEKTKAKTMKDVRKLAAFWQLTATKQTTGEPFILGEQYSYGSQMTSRNKFRKLLEGWQGFPFPDGEPIDPTAFLDRECQITVIHKPGKEGKKHANMTGVGPAFDGYSTPPLTRPAFFYHLSMGEPPDLSFLPRLYGRTVVDIMADSKERSGKLAGSAQATYIAPPLPAEANTVDRTGDPDPERQSILDFLTFRANQGLQAGKGTPKYLAAVAQVEAAIRDHKITLDEQSEEVRDLLTPF